MKIYETNKVEYATRVGKCDRCDFCGQDLNQLDYGAYCEYVLDYGSSDPCMGASGDEYEFCEEYGINPHAFFHEPYSFCPSPDFDCESSFLKWAVHCIDEISTLDGALREIRMRTTSRLLKSGEIKPEDVRGE